MNERCSLFAKLATEQSRAELADLDSRPTAALVDALTGADVEAVEAVRAAASAITSAVELVVDRLAQGGRLIYVGAGTAGRIAALDAAELPPTFGIAPEVVRAVLAGGRRALVEAVEGAEDDVDSAERDLRVQAPSPADVVVGISASGRTPYVLAALRVASAAGAATIGIANNPDSKLAALADLAIELATGPEVVAGSTRLKAGTSQKLVLNALSTATMIRLGKVYRNLMVEMHASNQKQRIRAARIVVEATGVEEGEARGALDAAGWHAKTAIVMLLAGASAGEATELLARAGGRVREAVR